MEEVTTPAQPSIALLSQEFLWKSAWAEPLGLNVTIQYSKSFSAFSPAKPFSALSQGSSACLWL